MVLKIRIPDNIILFMIKIILDLSPNPSPQERGAVLLYWGEGLG